MNGVVKLLFGSVEKTFNGAKNFFVFICQGILDFLFDKIKSLFIHIIMIVRKKLDFLLFNNIKKTIFINNFFLTSIRNILLTMNIYIPSIKPNSFFFVVCLLIYITIWFAFLFNLSTIFMNPSNSVNVLLLQNIILLMCSLFYNGSGWFLEISLNLEKLNFLIYFFLITIISIFLPKNYILHLFLIIILFISNLFILFNLVLFLPENDEQYLNEEL